MKNQFFIALVCITALINSTMGENEKQIQLEDIERDTLIHETDRSSDGIGQKELTSQPTQHIQLSYNRNPQDVFVTPSPGRYAVKANPQVDLRQQIYHLPKVHEAGQTYSVPAKQSLIKPIIGGGEPIYPNMITQPQYVYIPSSPQSHHPYISQAPAYVMVPIVQQPTPAPIYTYSEPHPTSLPIHAVKSLEYNVPSAQIAPLHTTVDFKNMPTIVPKHTLPSIATTSFRQYYSPGLEYHYTEVLPSAKFQPGSPSYAYHHTPTHNYHTSFVSQPSPYYYQNIPAYKQQHYAHYEPVVADITSYPKQHTSHKNIQASSNQLFSPAQYPMGSHASSVYTYPSYNTIAYSVPYPPYDHSKRSTPLQSSVKVPKSS